MSGTNNKPFPFLERYRTRITLPLEADKIPRNDENNVTRFLGIRSAYLLLFVTAIVRSTMKTVNPGLISTGTDL